MKKAINLNFKQSILLVIVFLLIIPSLNFVKANQEELYCAEKTNWPNGGAWCQMVPLDEVNTNYRYSRTSCESTEYCSVGTCVNTLTGKCLPGPQATCDPEKGGYFYNKDKDEVAECKIGCCFLGDGAAMVERVKCDALGREYNLNAEFRAGITEELVCLAMASPKSKGACVLGTEVGRSCSFITREECQSSQGEFHEDLLCTNPILGTVCAMTQRTTCVSGKNEVYFVDSCGNIANVYDANKIDDIAYWSYVPGVEGVEIDWGPDSNAGSRILGSCDYLLGSTCARYDRSIDGSNAKPDYGNYVCRDLSCPESSLTGGIKREHGESWCSKPLEYFENAKPGDISYLLYCYNGEVKYELCDHYRNSLCYEEKASDGRTTYAGCTLNEWTGCIFQDNTRDCENLRDCKVLENVGVFRTSYGTEQLMLNSTSGEMIRASCVPKYSPGFKFWDPTGTIPSLSSENPGSICELSNVVCYVHYTQELIWTSVWRADPFPECVELCKKEGGGAWSCTRQCTPICFDGFTDQRSNTRFDVYVAFKWAKSWQNLCSSLGDCGAGSNYMGTSGYNSWKDLFIPGNHVKLDNIPE
ncbi:hypothetical protein K0A97_01475 [Patescibacteria group bacterium]|nr:hypothetical protein [Patescibacteria group bacterium]